MFLAYCTYWQNMIKCYEKKEKYNEETNKAGYEFFSVHIINSFNIICSIKRPKPNGSV